MTRTQIAYECALRDARRYRNAAALAAKLGHTREVERLLKQAARQRERALACLHEMREAA